MAHHYQCYPLPQKELNHPTTNIQMSQSSIEIVILCEMSLMICRHFQINYHLKLSSNSRQVSNISFFVKLLIWLITLSIWPWDHLLLKQNIRLHIILISSKFWQWIITFNFSTDWHKLYSYWSCMEERLFI